MAGARLPARAFLLPADLPGITLAKVAALVLDPAVVALDTVSFPEGGGDVDLELSVPLRPGMDEVVVDEAQLTLEAADIPLAITRWRAAAGPEGRGAFLILDVPARLGQLTLDPANAPAGAFVVVRAATLGPDGAPVAGPPLFAGPGFDTGPMLPRALAGMVVEGSGDQLVITPPLPQGQSWLVQFATGTSPAALTPVAGQPTITRVTVVPAPADVALLLRGRGPDEADTTLWRHPGALLPDAGRQLADFTPAAGRRLNQALTVPPGATPAATLALPLRLRSASAGAMRLGEQILHARYVVHPAAGAPMPLTFDGDWVDLPLDAPPLRPSVSTLTLSARHLGRQVNPGSPLPPIAPPSGGVRVRADRIIAAAVSWSPADTPTTGPAGSTASARSTGRAKSTGRAGPAPALAVVRLLVAPVGDTELVAEVRADAAGAPGAPLAGPLVLRLDERARPGGPRWVSLALPVPVAVPAPATLWVTVRANLGELRWFTAVDGPPPRVSVDGRAWGKTDAGLAPPGRPWLRLLHTVDPAAAPPPTLAFRRGEMPLGTVTLTPTGRPGEYTGPSPATLPAAVVDALAAPPSPGADAPRRVTTFSLLTTAALRLTVTELTCSYDPFG
ncbi:hypothetical protein [Frankia gtarii]|uniref:hypothetical protein n=1 Tax=Frankia gtarii TaxID=2950102 RepID=UPI0021BF64EC|nr:hypothetical protein [Frankia gtarii]